MPRSATNHLLQKARKAKSDEFYTQLCDIERELAHYSQCFRGKVVYCNCDDPRSSNFHRYFVQNFHTPGLKRLITSCYKEDKSDLFHSSGNADHGCYCIYEGQAHTPPAITQFKGDGDFRSQESVRLLQASDIVVTNPPFSLFREHIAQLVRHEKQYLVIGNINAITYKEIFSLIQQNRAWPGVNMGRGISGFIVPEHYRLSGTEASVNQRGERIVATNNCLWLTNIESAHRHARLRLTKQFRGNEGLYPKFDNCDGINIDRTQDIPADYDGLMGVPITFLHKYNPDQFQIVRFRKGDGGRDPSVGGKCPYFRILVRHRACPQ